MVISSNNVTITDRGFSNFAAMSSSSLFVILENTAAERFVFKTLVKHF